jgi:hypothetical protein
MRTGAARGQAGHFHEAGFYGSDAEFRALIVPFAEEGIAAGDRVVVTVHDTGRGPADPLAGLVPVPSSTPDRHLGLGLWVMHQLDIDVTLRHASDGFTVRLRHLPGSSRPAATAG